MPGPITPALIVLTASLYGRLVTNATLSKQRPIELTSSFCDSTLVCEEPIAPASNERARNAAIFMVVVALAL
jgi:hypothetical protein